ncbi:MAG: NAD(P)/FAD-dependent oxidoreductase [Candidatus Eisenbacteria bacterium]|nr:NAD(P)/FAD-dependent oxidoreductase [Candidatus Eisenbacteria bacterium]
MNILIIGNGVAGVTAARRLRMLEPDAGIAVFTREPYHYYYKPRLPEVVAGAVDIESIIINPPDWYEDQGIDVRLSTEVTSIDTAGRKVVTADGGSESYDRLLVATGADPFVPPMGGTDLEGVFTLRTADDAVALREAARSARCAVVIGGGLLGLESARGLAASGVEVVALEVADRLLPRQLDEAGAALLRERIGELGIDVVTEAMCESIVGDDSVEAVSLRGGETLPADIVLISTGVRPSMDVVGNTGIDRDRGIQVDCKMRTNVPDVYAAGDVAELDGRVWGIIPAATVMAEAAAHGIEGESADCDIIGSNTLKISEVDVYSAGDVFCEGCTTHAYEDDGVYRKVLLDRGRLVGAIVVGSRQGVRELDKLILEGADVSAFGDAVARDDFDFKRALKTGA